MISHCHYILGHFLALGHEVVCRSVWLNSSHSSHLTWWSHCSVKLSGPHSLGRLCSLHTFQLDLKLSKLSWSLVSIFPIFKMNISHAPWCLYRTDSGLKVSQTLTGVLVAQQQPLDPDSVLDFCPWSMGLDFFSHLWLNAAPSGVTPTLTLHPSAPGSLNLEPNYKIRLLKGDPRFASFS